MSNKPAPVLIDLFDDNEESTAVHNQTVRSRLQTREEHFKQKEFRLGEEEDIRKKNNKLFFAPFENLVKDFEAQLELTTEAEVFLKKIKEMQDLLTLHSDNLKPYEQKRSQTKVDDLRKKCTEARKESASKKKFAFKRKTKKAIKTEPVIVPKEVPITKNKPSLMTEVKRQAEHQIEGLNGETLTITELNAESFHKELRSEFLIKNCVGTTIVIQGVLQTLRLSHLKECTILVGPVSRSIMVSHCTDCKINIASHQIRIHDSSRTTFSLLCKSNPIIEDCTELTFCPYSFDYASLDSHLIDTELSLESNRWDKVQDFNWLKNSPSPNFSLC